MIKKVYSVLFFLTIVILISYIILESGRIDLLDKGKVRPFSDDWITTSGKAVNIYDSKPGIHNGMLVIKKQLPDDLTDNDSFCFESRNGNVTIYVDDREIYSYESIENYTGIGFGNSFVEIPLKASDSGRMIRIELKGMYKKYGRVLSAYIGPAGDFIHMSIIKRALPAFVSGLIVFLGMLMICIYLTIPDKENMPFNILALGTAALIIGTWMLMDTNIMQLLTGRIYLWRGLNRSVILLGAYPCVDFFNSITRVKRKIYLHIGFWFNALLLAAILTARFAFGVDMIVTFFVATGVLLGGVLVLMIIIFADNALYCRKMGVDIGVRQFYPGVIAFIICGLTDVIMYASGVRLGDSYGIFSRFGFAYFVMLSMLQFLSWWTRDRADIERERFINRTLQYAMSYNSPDESIHSMLDYMGRKLKPGRICVFEEQDNGKYRGTYEWFGDDRQPAGIDLIYLPYEGMVDDLYKSFKANNGHLIADSPEAYKTTNPKFYNFCMQYSLKNVVAGPLETGGTLNGFLVFVDSPAEFLEETARIINIVSYFLNQLIVQRDEQERLRYYSYNDALSGALNRRAFNEYLEDGLDISQAFGLMICHINGFDETNRIKGYEAGDAMIIDTVGALTEVFGKERVYRIGGAEFAAFGFETDETLFDMDVERFRNIAEKKGVSISVGAVYCAFGTMDIKKVIKHANILLRNDM